MSLQLLDYLDPSLIFINKDMDTSESLFNHIYQKTFAKSLVRDDFGQRIMKREEEFPTGIQLEHIGVAIPHTDAECIYKEFVAIYINKPSIPFASMEDPNQLVQADVVFVLGLNQPHAQLEMLQKLIQLIQNDKKMSDLFKAKNNQDVYDILSK